MSRWWRVRCNLLSGEVHANSPTQAAEEAVAGWLRKGYLLSPGIITDRFVTVCEVETGRPAWTAFEVDSRREWRSTATVQRTEPREVPRG